MMECRNIDELMMEYLYRELDTSQTDAFRTHVDGCKRCTSELASLQATRQALRALPELEPSGDITSRLLAEASRRMPAVSAVGEREEKGFFAWIAAWMKPVMLHPGFAAAAALVLIGGVAGFLTLKNVVSTKTAHVDNRARVSADQPAAQLERGMLQAQPATPAAPMANAPTGAHAGENADNANAKDMADPAGHDGNDDGKRVRATTPEEEQRLNEVRPDTRNSDQATGEGDGYEGGTAPGRGKNYGVSPRPAQDPSGAENMNGSVDVGGEEQEAPADAKDAEKKKEATKESPTKATVKDPAVREPAKTPTPPPADKSPDKSPAKPVSPKRDQQDKQGGGGAGADANATMDDEAEMDGDAVRSDPEPQPTSVQSREDSGSAENAPQAKQKAKKESKKDDPKVLLGQARAKANTGNCAKANEIKKRLSKSDPEFYRQKVANDADLAKCDPARNRKKAGNKSPEPAMEKAPAQDTQNSTGN